MSSPAPVDSEQTDSFEPLAIQEIVDRITKLIDEFSKTLPPKAEDKAETRQQATAATGTNSATANNQTGNVSNKQEEDATQQEINSDSGRKGVHVSSGNNDQANMNNSESESNKNGEDASKQNNPNKEDEKKKFFFELEKLHKELQYMVSLFQKLKKFSSDLRKPLTTLEKNVNDILGDRHRVTESSLPKQVEINLRAVKNNITRVKIQIPLQHASSEANRPLQTTVATNEAYDLPQLYNEEKFESSYYFKEIEEKYNSLNDRHKLCLLCFAIFPENAEIKKRLLRFWWVGEKLLEGGEKISVDNTLREFVRKGFIEPIQKKNKLLPRSYKMNPIVRSCLIKFAKGEDTRFFDYDKEGKPTMNFLSCKKACMVKPSEGATASWFSEYLNGTADSKQKEPAKEDPERLSADLVKLQMLFNFPTREELMEASKKFNELQTLFNISRQFPALPKEWFSKMTDIHVLYLGGWESEAGRQRHIEVERINFLRGFEKMNKLRVLSLQGISGIPELPSSLCKLASLRILDLRACHNLEKLSDRIGLLKELTYLDLSECYLLDYIPRQLKELSKLEVLKGFLIGNAKNSCTLEDLAKLKELRKLSVNVHKTGFDIDYEEKALSKFEKLEKLRISWGSGSGKETENLDKGGKSSQKGNDKNWKSGEARSKSMKQQLENNTRQEEEENNREKTKRQDAAKSIGGKPDKKQGAGQPKPNGLENLVKLDLQCFPNKKPPAWLVPSKVKNLKNLSLRGGNLVKLNDDEQKWENVKIVHLKYLIDFKMNWKEMLAQFPNLEYLENVRCPRVTFCPCDASGVWQKPQTMKMENV